MDETAVLFRAYLEKFGNSYNGLCYKVYKTNDREFRFSVNENGKIMIFMDEDDKKYAMSFSCNENDFFFQLSLGTVTIYHGGFDKNMVNRNTDAVSSFVFGEETLYRLSDFWIGKKRTLEMVSFYTIRDMLLMLEFIMRDMKMPLRLWDFGFTNF